MTDGIRTQEVHPLEYSVKQLKETSNQQSLELKELARMMIAMNLNIDPLTEKSLVSMVSMGVCGLIAIKPRTGFAFGMNHTQTKIFKLNFLAFEGEILWVGRTSVRGFLSITKCWNKRRLRLPLFI